MSPREIYGLLYIFPTEINQILFSYMDLQTIRNMWRVNLIFRRIVSSTVTTLRGDVKSRDISWLSTFTSLRSVKGYIYFNTMEQLEQIFSFKLESFVVIDREDIVQWKERKSGKLLSRGDILVNLLRNHRNKKSVTIKQVTETVWDLPLGGKTTQHKYILSSEKILFSFDEGYVHFPPELADYFSDFDMKGVLIPGWSEIYRDNTCQYHMFRMPIKEIKLRHDSVWSQSYIIEAIRLNQHAGMETITRITWKSQNDLLSQKDRLIMLYEDEVDNYRYSFPKVEFCDIPVTPCQVSNFFAVFPNVKRVIVAIPSRGTRKSISICEDRHHSIIDRLEQAAKFVKNLDSPVPGKKNVYLYRGIECGIIFF